jgi:U3 small nucleolar RNA-associated protein 25
VDEDEEGPETAVEGVLEDDDDDDTEDLSDPFEAHFANPNDNLLADRLKALQQKQWSTSRRVIPKVGKLTIDLPGNGDAGTSNLPKLSVEGMDNLKLKQKLAGIAKKQRPTFDALEQTMAASIFNYNDVLYCERSPADAEKLRRLACLHAINHVFKTRDRVIKNNARLAKEDNDVDLELRDQGFTRPKVLMILPTRESCVRMVNMITSLCEPDQQENRKRFDDSYVDKEEKFSADKAEDFRELFAGNDDDMFRLGLKFTRKTIKYFSQFYNSDIIFASPLGLRMAIGTEEDKKVDYDFLSSIEVVIVDQADALLMQNWEHVEFIFDHLNLQPKEAHGCDFSRVRSWYLDNNAKHFRQNIALAAFNTPELNTLFFNRSQNWGGRVKINANYQGAIQELGLKVKQTFSRLESPSFASDPDSRFTYFTSAIVPALTRHTKNTTGTLIFVPSYLDFVRVRNYFSTSPNTSNLSFGSISEYSSVTEVARARSHFLSGRHSVLLYTERAHHFRRYQLRGVRKVIMYGLPDNPTFYKEIVGGYLTRSLQDGILEPGEGSLRAIFSKWDVLKLDRIVGTERVGKMIREKGDTFDFL